MVKYSKKDRVKIWGFDLHSTQELLEWVDDYYLGKEWDMICVANAHPIGCPKSFSI